MVTQELKAQEDLGNCSWQVLLNIKNWYPAGNREPGRFPWLDFWALLPQAVPVGDTLLCLGSEWHTELHSTLMGIRVYFLCSFLMSLFSCRLYFLVVSISLCCQLSQVKVNQSWGSSPAELIWELSFLPVFGTTKNLQIKCTISAKMWDGWWWHKQPWSQNPH